MEDLSHEIEVVPVPRRQFIFALRDTLPLDAGGHRVWLHDSDMCSRPCVDLQTCHGTVARFVQQEAIDGDFHDVVGELLIVASKMADAPLPSLADLPDGPLGYRTFATVSTPMIIDGTPVSDEAAFESAFGAVQGFTNGLRLATRARLPRMTLERLWPVYARSDAAENLESSPFEIILDESKNPYATPLGATPEQLARANHYILAAHNSDPVEIVQDFATSARLALGDGDYVQTILCTAASSEVLLKHVAGMLTWEGLTYHPEPPSWIGASGSNPLALDPSKLIGAILSQTLGGSWESKSESKPIGAWRNSIAVVRNRVIHRGHRPSIGEANAAIRALDRLSTFICDRLANNVRQFPRTAVCLGGVGSDRRPASRRVTEIISAADTAGEDWRRLYRVWVERVDVLDGFEN